MVECSPATRAARVRFPADASFAQNKQIFAPRETSAIPGLFDGLHLQDALHFTGNYVRRSYLPKIPVRQPGVEPGSTAWKATMLTVTPLTLHRIRIRSDVL